MLTNNNMDFGGHHIIFPLLEYLLCFGSHNRMLTTASSFFASAVLNLEHSIFSFPCSLFLLPSRVKNGADTGPFLLVVSTFTLPAPGAIPNLVASSATASRLVRCVPSSSHAAAYAYGENWKLEIRTTVRQ